MEANTLFHFSPTLTTEMIDSDLDLRLLHDHHRAMSVMSTVITHAPENRPAQNRKVMIVRMLCI